MLMIPQHVRNLAERVKKELVTQEAADRTDEAKTCLDLCSEAISEMEEQKIFTELRVISIIQKVLKSAAILRGTSYRRAFTEVEFQPSFDMALGILASSSKSVERRHEILRVMQSIENISSLAIGQDYEMEATLANEFHYVKGESAWNRLFSKYPDLKDISKDRFGNPLYSYLKIAYRVVKEHPYYSIPKGLIRKYKNALLEQLEKPEDFYEVEEAFNILCRQGKIGIYYIYVPNE